MEPCLQYVLCEFRHIEKMEYDVYDDILDSKNENKLLDFNFRPCGFERKRLKYLAHSQCLVSDVIEWLEFLIFLLKVYFLFKKQFRSAYVFLQNHPSSLWSLFQWMNYGYVWRWWKWDFLYIIRRDRIYLTNPHSQLFDFNWINCQNHTLNKLLALPILKKKSSWSDLGHS
jgi:hypothetical protein